MLLFFSCAALPALADDARRLALGRHLSGECSACHRIDGIDNGIPSITGWPSEDFIATMAFYRDGARPNPAMASVARSLDEEQIKALAAYYGSLPKPPKRSAAPR
jgi:cytochrome c